MFKSLSIKSNKAVCKTVYSSFEQDAPSRRKEGRETSVRVLFGRKADQGIRFKFKVEACTTMKIRVHK
jgi:hypothetical protein